MLNYSDANGLALPTNYSFSTNKTNRTDFSISYSFKSGYTYSIEITAFGDVSVASASLPTIGATPFTTGGLTYVSTSCGANDMAGFPIIGSLFITELTTTPATYSPPNANFISPNNFDYLLLEGFVSGATSDVTANAYIKQIKIKASE